MKPCPPLGIVSVLAAAMFACAAGRPTTNDAQGEHEPVSNTVEPTLEPATSTREAESSEAESSEAESSEAESSQAESSQAESSQADAAKQVGTSSPALEDTEAGSDSDPVLEASLGRPRDVPFPVPAELEACERDWLLATQTSPEVTARCIEVFLGYGYGNPPSEYQLNYDPFYGSKIELRYTGSQLRRMAALAEANCTPNTDGSLSRCERAVEFLSGMAERKTSLLEDVNVDGIEGALAKILAGERLTDHDLWLHHELLGFSTLSLWKLDAAIAARHGQPFADEDLDAFFYTGRVEDWAEHGLPELAPNPNFEGTKLSAADRHNRALIERAQARKLGKREANSLCFLGERVVFGCDLDDDRTVSLCGSDTLHPPKLDRVVLRIAHGNRLDSIPSPAVGLITAVARFGQRGGLTVVELEQGGRFRIEREQLGTDAPRYRVTLASEVDGSDVIHSCTTPSADELDAVGVAIPADQWIELARP